MLRGIPTILPPVLVKLMMEMGHGDELVLADRNFPAFSIGKRVVECYSSDICEMLSAIIPFFPLDQAVGYNMIVMSPTQPNAELELWKQYSAIAQLSKDNCYSLKKLSKLDFYEESKTAYLVVITGEKKRFANLILRKGILGENE